MPEEAAKLRDLLAGWRSTHAEPAAKGLLSDEERRRALEALGYIEPAPKP